MSRKVQLAVAWLIAAVIAVPLAVVLMNSWLQNFAYKVELHWWIFVGSAFISLLIALLTVSYQAIRAALVNPVKSLKTE